MDKTPLVTIIIPLYNMEKLIQKCVDSIIGQTYKNLQIIIIDDGSTDHSGAIADLYQSKDNRVKVIHHETNKGIACGFISGINEARGEYLVIIDSDNYVDSAMISKLVSTALKMKADIVQGEAYCYIDESDAESIKGNSELQIRKVMNNKNEMINDYLNEETITNNLAAKIFRKELFNDVIIPEGHQVVDAITLMQLINNSSTYVCLEDVVYYAYQAPNSISRSAISERRLKDLIFSNKFTSDFIKKNWSEWKDYIYYRNIRTACWTYNQVYLSQLTQREEHMKQFRRLFRDNYKKAKTTRYYEKVSSRDKAKYFLFYFSPVVCYNALLKIRFR